MAKTEIGVNSPQSVTRLSTWLGPDDIEKFSVSMGLDSWLRISPYHHHQTPLAVVAGPSRFIPPGEIFGGLYAARNMATAIAETIVRDNFEYVPKSERVIYNKEVADRCMAEVSSKRQLKLLNLTGANAFRLGINTDTVGAKHHGTGQEASKNLYRAFPHVDGILYDSRLSKGRCVVVYDRAVSSKLKAGQVMRLSETGSIVTALDEIGFSYVEDE